MSPLPKRFFDPIDQIPTAVDNFEDFDWMFPKEDRPKTKSGHLEGLIWMQRNEGEFLWECVKKRPPRTNIVEIGRCEGGSAVLMGAAMNNGELLSVDIDPVDDDQLVKILELLGISNVELAIGDSSSYEPKIKNVGLLLIDGDHEYESVKADYEHWISSVVRGGLVLFHDVKPGTGPNILYGKLTAAGSLYPIKTVGTLEALRY